MAKFTQVRLAQITGSAPDLITTDKDFLISDGAGSPNLAAADLGDILKAYGQTLSAISGKGDFFGQEVGQLKHDLGRAKNNQVRLIATGTVANSGLQIGITEHAAPTNLDFTTKGASLLLQQGNAAGSEGVRLLNYPGTGDVETANPALVIEAAAGGIEQVAQKDFRLMSNAKLHMSGANGATILAEDGVLALSADGDGAAKGILALAPQGTITLESGRGNESGAVVVNASASTSKISLQNAGSSLLEVETNRIVGTTAAEVKFLKTIESDFTDGVAALLVSGGVRIEKNVDLVKGDLIANAGDVLLKTDGKKVKLGSAGVAQLEKVSGVNKGQFTVAGTAGWRIGVSGSAGAAVHGGLGGVLLTGAFGPLLGGNGLFGFGGGTEGGLATYGQAHELVHYKSTFVSSGSGTTSIIAALNNLDSRIASTDQSSFKLVQPSDASGTPSVTVSLEAGDAANFKTAAKNQLDVFVNGQLLISGASDADGDYKVDATGTNKIQFFFPLKADDVIRVLDKQ